MSEYQRRREVLPKAKKLNQRIHKELQLAERAGMHPVCILVHPAIRLELEEEKFTRDPLLEPFLDPRPLDQPYPVVETTVVDEDEIKVVTDWHEVPWREPVIKPHEEHQGAWRRFKQLWKQGQRWRAVKDAATRLKCYLIGHKLYRGHSSRVDIMQMDTMIASSNVQAIRCARCDEEFARDEVTPKEGIQHA